MTVETLVSEAQKLSTYERLRMIELLTHTLQVDLAPVDDWHAALRSCYGILADDPIERPPQLPLEERESIE